VKAVVGRRFAKPDALRIEDVEKPVVTDDSVLVRVHATSANPVDLFLPKPTIVGYDFAGTIEAVGRHVTGFKPGDEVFGEAN
jgi:NADPH:quinone reductase-like Zn-dependent oxidoreductase